MCKKLGQKKIAFCTILAFTHTHSLYSSLPPFSISLSLSVFACLCPCSTFRALQQVGKVYSCCKGIVPRIFLTGLLILAIIILIFDARKWHYCFNTPRYPRWVKDYIQLVYDHFKKQVNWELTGFLTSNHPAERNKISLSRCECTKKGFQGFWDTLYKIGSTYKRGCAERDLTQHNTFCPPY